MFHVKYKIFIIVKIGFFARFCGRSGVSIFMKICVFKYFDRERKIWFDLEIS